MPTWTQNELHVFGERSDIEKFFTYMGENMDFEKVITPPENMVRDNLSSVDEARCKANGIPTWRDWQIENWGTKWNACHCEKAQIDDYPKSTSSCLTYKFMTAWATPEPIIRKLIKQYPELEFTGGWVDEGYDGCGNFQQFWEK